MDHLSAAEGTAPPTGDKKRQQTDRAAPRYLIGGGLKKSMFSKRPSKYVISGSFFNLYPRVALPWAEPNWAGLGQAGHGGREAETVSPAPVSLSALLRMEGCITEKKGKKE